MSTVVDRPGYRGPAHMIAAMAIGLVAIAGCTKSIESSPTPVVLEAALSQGDSPWTQSVAEVVDLADVVTLDARVGPGGHPDSLAATAGLYGGSTDRTVCDVPRLVSFLEAEPNKAAAWREVLGVRDIRSYVATLQPVVVMKDTMVTDHGFNAGRPTDHPAVLQAGTAILLDPDWIPRVRCASGSPLTPPPRVSLDTATYSGQQWPSFDADHVVHATHESPVTTTTHGGSAPSHTIDSGSPAQPGTGSTTTTATLPDTDGASGGGTSEEAEPGGGGDTGDGSIEDGGTGDGGSVEPPASDPGPGEQEPADQVPAQNDSSTGGSESSGGSGAAAGSGDSVGIATASITTP